MEQRAHVGESLNLLALARASGEGTTAVPGTYLSVRRVAGRVRERTASAAWLLVLEGRLIVDLPHGDFRILARGDALHLPADLDMTLQSVEGEALLVWRSSTTP